MTVKVARPNNALNKLKLLTRGVLILAAIGTEQIRQVLKESLALCLQVIEDPLIGKYFFTYFCRTFMVVALMKCVLYLSSMLKMNQGSFSWRFNKISVLISYDALLFFHFISPTRTSVKSRSLVICQLSSNGMIIYTRLRLIARTWCILFEELGLLRLSNDISQYIWYDEAQAPWYGESFLQGVEGLD